MRLDRDPAARCFSTARWAPSSSPAGCACARSAPRRGTSSGPTRCARSTPPTPQAGAEVVQTNSFGGTRPRLARFGLRARSARHPARRRGATGARRRRPRLPIIGSLGPTGETLPLGGAPDARLARRGLRRGGRRLLAEAGVDAIHLETQFHPAELRGGDAGARAGAPDLPIIASMTLMPGGPASRPRTACRSRKMIRAALEAARPTRSASTARSKPSAWWPRSKRCARRCRLPVWARPQAKISHKCATGRRRETPETFARQALALGACRRVGHRRLLRHGPDEHRRAAPRPRRRSRRRWRHDACSSPPRACILVAFFGADVAALASAALATRFGDPGDLLDRRSTCRARTSSIQPGQLVCAHRTLPCGTVVHARRTRAPASSRVCEVLDRGPFGAILPSGEWGVKIRKSEPGRLARRHRPRAGGRRCARPQRPRARIELVIKGDAAPAAGRGPPRAAAKRAAWLRLRGPRFCSPVSAPPVWLVRRTFARRRRRRATGSAVRSRAASTRCCSRRPARARRWPRSSFASIAWGRAGLRAGR